MMAWCFEHLDTGWTSVPYSAKAEAMAAALADYAQAVSDDPRLPKTTDPEAVQLEFLHDRSYVFHRRQAPLSTGGST